MKINRSDSIHVWVIIRFSLHNQRVSNFDNCHVILSIQYWSKQSEHKSDPIGIGRFNSWFRHLSFYVIVQVTFRGNRFTSFDFYSFMYVRARVCAYTRLLRRKPYISIPFVSIIISYIYVCVYTHGSISLLLQDAIIHSLLNYSAISF